MGPVFIVGCDRSGTTLLRLMLVKSPVLHIPAETRFLTSLKKKSRVYGDFAQAYRRRTFVNDLKSNKATSTTYTFPAFKLTEEEAEKALAGAAPTNYPGAAAALFAASAHKVNKKRWGDKTPKQVSDILWLARAFPNAQFIHVIRDGRDVAASILKAGWTKDAFEAAYYWVKQVQAGRKAGLSLGDERYREVRYEKLIAQPEATLKKLCDWLHIEYTGEMLKYYKDSHAVIPKEHASLFELADKPLESSRVYAWKRNLSKWKIGVFESTQSSLLKELGYEVTGTKVPLWWRSFFALKKIIYKKRKKS